MFSIYYIVLKMISLEQMFPTSRAHLKRYGALLDDARGVPEVATYLPEIFEEDTPERIQQGIRKMNAMRYFVVVDGKDIGRVELTRELNGDPSIFERTPEDVYLGYNTCYFIIPTLTGGSTDEAHRVTANLSIRKAFDEGDTFLLSSPWLPIDTQGTNDPSRGWLMQEDNDLYTVHIDKAQTGFLPQYGIDDIPLSIVYALAQPETEDF
jgi:hypothetical protein